MLGSAIGLAEPTDTIEVTGAIAKTGQLTVKELEALGSTKATWLKHKKKHQVIGVPLGRVLTNFGFTSGEMGPGVAPADKCAGYKKVVVVTARDGFQAVFSTAELMEDMGATKALLIWSLDGKPLPAEQGPVRLAVLTDKEGQRSPWAVAKVELVEVGAKH